MSEIRLFDNNISLQVTVPSDSEPESRSKPPTGPGRCCWFQVCQLLCQCCQPLNRSLRAWARVRDSLTASGRLFGPEVAQLGERAGLLEIPGGDGPGRRLRVERLGL
jgi:hypothetical protein